MKANLCPSPRDDDEFPGLLEAVQDRFRESEGPYFTTDASDLFGVFLAGLPDHLRQTYTCHACRRFVEQYGGLVTIGEAGEQVAAVWPRASEAPQPFHRALLLVDQVVSRAKVTGVFLSSELTWGTPETGYWSHLAVVPKASALYRQSPLKTAGQAMAEKMEERAMLLRGLAEFSRETVGRALPLLESDSLYRSEKCLGVARWLLELHALRDATKQKDHRENIVWRAVALAPPGWAHVRSTMIGTLLDDIASGMGFDAISRRFAEKMHPLQYLRPQAAPSAGLLAQAEKVVAALKSAGSLERRYARLDEIEKLWEPRARSEEAKPASVFGHLAAKGTAAAPRPLDPPPITITWEKFAREVLPRAERIECHVPTVGPFVGLVTASNPEAPPILQWDHEEHRNPVSGYVYHRGSPASQWRLAAGTWTEVNAVTLLPSQWHGGGYEQHGKGAIFILAGAADQGHGGAAIFPETLRSEYHAIRSAIEAYSHSADLGGREEASACGIQYQGQEFRVTVSSGRLSYRIDRWD